jgi:hypothetical protein
MLLNSLDSLTSHDADKYQVQLDCTPSFPL